MEKQYPHFKTYLVLLVMAVTLTGCSSLDQQQLQDPAPLTDYEISRGVTEQWQVELGVSPMAASAVLQPVLFVDQVVAVDGMGLVQALDRSTGDTIWEHSLDQQISAGLGRYDNHLYLAATAGHLLALDSSTGMELWRVGTSSEVLSVPQANATMVVVQAIDGRISAYTRDTGAFLWSFSADLPGLTLRGTSTPVLTSDLTYAGFANGKLVALDNRNGAVVWQQRISVPQGRSEVARLVDIDGSLRLDGQLLFISSYQSRLAAVHVLNGELMWHQPVSSRHAPVVARGQVVVIGEGGRMRAYDGATGHLLWQNRELAWRGLSGLLVIDDAVLVSDQAGYLHILDFATGLLLGRVETGLRGGEISAVRHGKELYLQGQTGDLTKLVLD